MQIVRIFLEDTKPRPVSVVVKSALTADKEFKVDVRENPVNPTTSSAVTVPRLDVKLKPVNVSVADSTEPQPF